MNSPEFRLLDIWRCVVEMKNVRQKMVAYNKIASQVGISERNVRENIRKLVEQGYLVSTDNWYELNFDCDFIKYIVKKSVLTESRENTEPNDPIFIVSEPEMKYGLSKPKDSEVVQPFPVSGRQVELADESIAKFHDTFGVDVLAAIDFFKNEVLKNYCF